MADGSDNRARTLGVLGAGTMGAGIAQVGLAAGLSVVVCDPWPEALAGAVERIGRGLEKQRERKGELGPAAEDPRSVLDARLRTSTEMSSLAPCDFVIEAAPEDLALKQEIVREAGAVTQADAVIASNTSSLPITMIAAGAADPTRVVGMHFFNPVPFMPLVEVIPAEQTAPDTLARATSLGELLGKRVLVAPDGPGFLVNRCGRSFSSEALRVLQERIAEVEQIDRICRIAGGFRMGPFELMDLVGIDVGLAVARSFTELSFGEPRWRPSPLQARKAASGNLGRKTGAGWYAYGTEPYRNADPDPPEPGGGAGRALGVVGTGPVAEQLRERALAAGFAVRDRVDAEALANVFADPDVAAGEIDGAAQPIVSCARHSLAFRRIPAAVGFSVPNHADGRRLVELTRTAATPPGATEAARELFSALGLHQEWVADGPGLVLERILAQIVNEAAFAYGEGIGTAQDIDTGAMLGLSYPRGPLAWGEAIGWDRVLRTLDGIWQERREDRYRPAPALIAKAAEESVAASAGLEAAGREAR